MKKMLLMLAILLVASLASAQLTRYNSFVQVTEENLSSGATAYALTVTTKTVATCVARPGRCGGYIVNKSSIPVRVTPINYGSTWAAAQSILANGVRIEGRVYQQYHSTAVASYMIGENHKFYFDGHVGAFYLTLSDDASSTLAAEKVVVYDMWRP